MLTITSILPARAGQPEISRSYKSLMHDIVTHEVGHAAVDAIAPNLYMNRGVLRILSDAHSLHLATTGG